MNSTILRLASLALLGGKRIYLMAALPLVLLVLAILVRAFAGPSSGLPMVQTLGYALVLPLVALISASTVLGPEIDDGSLVYLLARPVDRRAVALSKYVAAVLATWVFAALPLALATLIVDLSEPRLALAWLAASLAAGAAYTALFLALTAVTKHAVVIGLLVVLLWQGLLGPLLGGIRWVDAGAWGRQIGSAVSDSIISPDLPTAYAVGACLVLVAAAVLFTGDRLRSFSMNSGD